MKSSANSAWKRGREGKGDGKSTHVSSFLMISEKPKFQFPQELYSTYKKMSLGYRSLELYFTAHNIGILKMVFGGRN